ncbi:MAG: glycosyltransferase family 4 protein [Planctomycetota bacterium]|jgi:UDP-glucose:(heptosyl)LPS alpha-1,3-glucosyltransferase
MSKYRMAFGVVKYFAFGGMQRNLLRIARECATRGHDVEIFVGEWVGPRPDDVSVTVLDVHAWTNHGRNQRFARAFRDAVGSRGFDCTIGSNRQADLDVYYAGDPCYAAVFHETKPALLSLLPRYQSFLRAEEELFNRDNDTDILLSAHDEKTKFIRYYETDSSRFHLLPPGIDRNRLVDGALSAEERESFRSELGVAPDGLLLLSVGSAFRTKGVDRTIRAIAGLPAALRSRVRLAVVGRGKAGPMRRLAWKHGIADRILFTGPREELAPFYYSGDLLVHAAYRENTGNTLIEAMVCGLPVLTTGVCGFAHHVTRAEAGLVCASPFVQGELNELLRTMLEHDRDPWRRSALAYCEHEDLYTLVDRAADAIEDRARRNHAANGRAR